jgi:PIN domain nuclease of toxin-antitoxin system
MNLLLDTCAIVWVVSAPEALSPAARQALTRTDSVIHVSPISLAEIACLVERGRIAVQPHWRTWFQDAVRSNGWQVAAIDLETVAEAFALPGAFHRDPADRLIVAAARLGRMAVVTADRRLRSYPHVQTLW